MLFMVAWGMKGKIRTDQDHDDDDKMLHHPVNADATKKSEDDVCSFACLRLRN
jgi:hypothetical protein